MLQKGNSDTGWGKTPGQKKPSEPTSEDVTQAQWVLEMPWGMGVGAVKEAELFMWVWGLRLLVHEAFVE